MSESSTELSESNRRFSSALMVASSEFYSARRSSSSTQSTSDIEPHDSAERLGRRWSRESGEKVASVSGIKDSMQCDDYLHLKAYIVLSCFVFWIVNPLFGLAAFIVAIVGKRNKEDGHYDKANRYAKMSCYLSVGGIIISAIIACIVVSVLLSWTAK